MNGTYRLYNFESGEYENEHVVSAAEARKRIAAELRDPDVAPQWRNEAWGYLNVADSTDAIMASDVEKE
jgi:hypothetical protein